MKFRDIFGAEEAGIRRYSNDDKPKRAEIAPFERVRITLVTLSIPLWPIIVFAVLLMLCLIAAIVTVIVVLNKKKKNIKE